MALDPWPSPSTVYRVGSPTLGAPLFDIGPREPDLSQVGEASPEELVDLSALREQEAAAWAALVAQEEADRADLRDRAQLLEQIRDLLVTWQARHALAARQDLDARQAQTRRDLAAHHALQRRTHQLEHALQDLAQRLAWIERPWRDRLRTWARQWWRRISQRGR